MVRRTTVPALTTALAASLLLTACNGDADAPDPLEPQDDTIIEDAPDPDSGAEGTTAEDTSEAGNGSSEDHVAASSAAIDGENVEIIGVECRPPDRPDFWQIQGEMSVEGDARYMITVTGNPAPDADENDFFMEIAIPRVPDEENRADRYQYYSAPETFADSADFEFSMESTSGSIVIEPQFRTVPGQADPLPDKDITFTLVCP